MKWTVLRTKAAVLSEVAAEKEKSPFRGSLSFAPCKSSGYVVLPKSFTQRYPSSLL